MTDVSFHTENKTISQYIYCGIDKIIFVILEVEVFLCLLVALAIISCGYIMYLGLRAVLAT